MPATPHKPATPAVCNAFADFLSWCLTWDPKPVGAQLRLSFGRLVGSHGLWLSPSFLSRAKHFHLCWNLCVCLRRESRPTDLMNLLLRKGEVASEDGKHLRVLSQREAPSSLLFQNVQWVLGREWTVA